MNDDTLDAVIALFDEKGSDAWFTDAPESYLGDACVCPKCGGHHLKADRDILDVWWDSGVSWKAVCEYRPELKYPADVYLEGSDQHRGWFQSSLLTSVGTNGIAPYKAVISQGFRPAPWLVPVVASDFRGQQLHLSVQGRHLPGIHPGWPGPQDVQVARYRDRPQQDLR